MNTRSALALLGVVSIGSAMLLTGGNVAGAAVRGADEASSSSVIYASVLHSKHGPDKVESSIKGLTVPSGESQTSFIESQVHQPVHSLYKESTAAAQGVTARAVRSHATSKVRISGAFSVSKVPSAPSVFAGVVACPGGTTFNTTCGTTNRLFFAQMKFAKGSTTGGTYLFSGLAAQAKGWQIGIMLFDGDSNGGYYPTNTPATVAKNSATAPVTKDLTMAYVAPQLESTFVVQGAPADYHYFFEAVACPSSVTPDQLVAYEDAGDCALVGSQNHAEVGMYLAPGSWTLRYYYEPYQAGVEMAASNAVITKNFDITGPTESIPTESTLVTSTVTGPYVTPSVTGTVASNLPAHTTFAELVFVDPSTNRVDAGLGLNAQAGSSTSFDAFLDDGTYTPYSEVAPPVRFNFNAAVSFYQVILRKLGADVTVASPATSSVSFTMQTYSASIRGSFAIPGVWDPSNLSGEVNVQPFTWVVVCPATEAFSLECANGLFVSPTMLLGGSFTIYADSQGVNMAFTYTTLDGHFVEGPVVSVPASSSLATVTLTAPYAMPNLWGHVILSAPANAILQDLWVQACPGTEAFSIDCAGGVSVFPPSIDSFSPSTSTITFGYAIDLAHGNWRLAVVGSTDANFQTDQRLGPIKNVDVGTSYPAVNLSATA